MSRRFPYISGHCGIGRHPVCTITYGAYGRTADCACRCHKGPVVDGQLDIFSTTEGQPA